MAKTVGIVGAGTMGSAMARNLIAAGFKVVGRDVDPVRADALAAMGGSVAGSPRAVAEAADCVLTSLPSAAAFEAAIGGADGIGAADRPGLVAFDTSTLPIPVKEAARDVLAETGKILLDVPLSGTGAQAVTKDLVVYASGDSAAIAGLSDVFEGFSRAHYDLGEFGNGSRMKFVANLLVAIHNVAAGEAFALGIKAGLAPETVFEVISNSAATSRIFEVRGPQMVANDYAASLGDDRHVPQGSGNHRQIRRRNRLRRPPPRRLGPDLQRRVGPGPREGGRRERVRGDGGAGGGGEVGGRGKRNGHPGRVSKGFIARISSGAK